MMTTTINSETTQAEVSKQRRSMSNLALRLITGLSLIPLVFILILWGGWPFTIMMSLLAAMATLEFYFMERRRGLHNNVVIGIAAAAIVILSFHLRDARLWQGALLISLLITFALEFGRSRQLQRSLIRVGTTLWGILYIAFPFGFLIAIRQIQPFGIHWVAAVLFSTWSTDTFSYLFGNMFGKTKLAPRISPGKTVEGAVAGVVFGAIMPMLVLLRIDALTTSAVILFIICPFVAIAGDLFESGLKRYFGVKDSHIPGFNIFPGHGGALDRIDSLLWIMTIFYVYMLLTGNLHILM